MLAVFAFSIQTSLGVRPRCVREEFAEWKGAGPNEVVTRDFIPVEHGELGGVGRFVLSHVEQEFLIPCRVERVSNDSGTEDFLSERDDNEGVHVVSNAQG